MPMMTNKGDPDDVLVEVRSLRDRMLNNDNEQIDTGDAVRLAHLFGVLDDLMTAGRVPEAWGRIDGNGEWHGE